MLFKTVLLKLVFKLSFEAFLLLFFMLRLEKFVTDSKSFIEEEGKEGEREREKERGRKKGGVERRVRQ